MILEKPHVKMSFDIYYYLFSKHRKGKKIEKYGVCLKLAFLQQLSLLVEGNLLRLLTVPKYIYIYFHTVEYLI